MRRNLILIFTIILIGLGVYAYDPAPKLIATNAQTTSAQKINAATAPDISFTSLDGTAYKLSQFKGKLVLLHFWASWCAPCVVELPSLVRLAQDYKDEIIILTFSSDTDAAAAKRFLAKQSINLHGSNIIWTWDRDKQVTYDTFQTMVLPETILLDRSLRMVKKYVGDSKWDQPAIRAEIDGFLKAAGPVSP